MNIPLLLNVLLQLYSVFIKLQLTIQFTDNQNKQRKVHLETPIPV